MYNAMDDVRIMQKWKKTGIYFVRYVCINIRKIYGNMINLFKEIATGFTLGL